MTDAQLHEHDGVTYAIGKLLAGRPPESQSAILADCLATWVCGYVVFGDTDATRQARDMALGAHMALVMTLITTGVCEPKGGNN